MEDTLAYSAKIKAPTEDDYSKNVEIMKNPQKYQAMEAMPTKIKYEVVHAPVDYYYWLPFWGYLLYDNYKDEFYRGVHSKDQAILAQKGYKAR